MKMAPYFDYKTDDVQAHHAHCHKRIGERECTGAVLVGIFHGVQGTCKEKIIFAKYSFQLSFFLPSFFF